MARSTWGSIRAKSKGVWEIRYPVDGKPRSETVRGTKKQAEQRKAELQVEYGPDDHRRSPLTVRGCWMRYYRPHIVIHNAPSTVAGYDSAYHVHIDPDFGMRQMESIRPAEIQQWLDGMTYGAAKKSRAVIRAMFNFAAGEELIGRNVMALKRYASPKKSKGTTREACKKIHDPKTLKAILGDCRGEVWEAGFILSAFGGLRRCEAIGVQIPDVAFIAPGTYDSPGLAEGFAAVDIRRDVQVIHGAVLVLDDLKTEDSAGIAIIPMPYANRLREIMESQTGELWLLGDGFGGPANPETMASAYQRWFLAHKYEYIPWKNLRTSYATMLHKQGVDLGMMSKLLRHSSMLMTYQHYDKPSVETLATEAAKIDA